MSKEENNEEKERLLREDIQDLFTISFMIDRYEGERMAWVRTLVIKLQHHECVIYLDTKSVNTESVNEGNNWMLSYE